MKTYKTAAVIPCYKVKNHIIDVIAGLSPQIIDLILVVDDKCPEQTGLYVEKNCVDPRVKIIYHRFNQGVGGAVVSGYKAALDEKCSIVVKVDGDGQMPIKIIEELISPIITGKADYVKGNRFFNIDDLLKMPKIRLLGNSILSFISKMSSGYWDIMDPTNGFTAISSAVLEKLPFDKISKRYFFESDMLFRLNTYRAVIAEIPHQSIYEDEESNLKIKKIIIPFLYKYSRNFVKRIFYTYFIRNFNVGSVEIIVGCFLVLIGLVLGGNYWTKSILLDIPATSGQVMLSALPLILGFQSLLAAMQYDVNNTPKQPISKSLLKKND
jgi:hypothetical protein